jgi:cell division protein FtsA
MKKGKLVIGLDVGTTNTRVVVGEVHPYRRQQEGFPSRDKGNGGSDSVHEFIDIIGIGNSPSMGIRKGVVVDIENTVESIRRTVEEAETMAGIEIKAVFAGISGGHIQSFLSHGITAVRDKDISQREIDRVIDAAKAVAIPVDRDMLHVVPVSFTVDGQNGIQDPRGMGGVRLETDVRIVTGSVASVKNLVKSCQRAGLDVIEVVLGPLACAEAELGSEERELGVGIVDIGGGTTDIALFQGGSLCHTAVLGIGGNNFTNDVAIGLRVTSSEAERIKINYGYAQLSMVEQDEEMEVVYPGNKPKRKIPRQHLIEILQPRAEELLYLVKEEITRSGFHGLMTSGIVLAGGAMQMQGMDVMAENILELPVRVGKPKPVGGIADIARNPVFAAGVGLVFYGARDIAGEHKGNGNNLFSGMTVLVRETVRDMFK